MEIATGCVNRQVHHVHLKGHNKPMWYSQFVYDPFLVMRAALSSDTNCQCMTSKAKKKVNKTESCFQLMMLTWMSNSKHI